MLSVCLAQAREIPATNTDFVCSNCSPLRSNLHSLQGLVVRFDQTGDRWIWIPVTTEVEIIVIFADHIRVGWTQAKRQRTCNFVQVSEQRVYVYRGVDYRSSTFLNKLYLLWLALLHIPAYTQSIIEVVISLNLNTFDYCRNLHGHWRAVVFSG